MKKFVIIIATVTALSAFGCSKVTETLDPEDPQVVAEKAVSLSAQVGDATRVSADNAGVFKWQASDHITILTSEGTNREFTAEDAGLTTNFSGTIPDSDELEGGYALYPVSANHVSAGAFVDFVIDENQVWSADASNMPMFAKIAIVDNEPQASFSAVGGTLKLICYNIPSEAKYLVFTAASKKISGTFTFDSSEQSFYLSDDKENPTDSEKRIVVDFSAHYSSSKVFYIPLPVVTLTGGFTIAFYNDLASTPLFSVTSPKALVITANKLIIAPALNCAPETVLWSENFSSFSVGEQSSGITYACVNGGSDTKTYNEELAGGSSPELLVGKASGSFTASAIPTNGAETMTLTFRENYDRITVSSTTDGVTVSGSFNSQKSLYTATVSNSKKANSIVLVFSNSESSNVRVDDIKLIIPGTSFPVPTITSDEDAFTIDVGETSASTNVALSNAIDGLGMSWSVEYPVEPEEVDAYKWISSVAIEGGVLTVTASGANATDVDKTATLTLKASGAAAKEIALTQTSALVPNPTNIVANAGDEQVEISWTADEHATGYVAYYRSADGDAFDSEGNPNEGTTAITGFTVSDGVYSKTVTGLSNNTEYTLYVKVSSVVDGGWVVPSSYATKTFAPAAALALSSIAVTTNPTKMAYSIGESFSMKGAVVTATYNDESTANVTSSCTTNYDSPATFTSAGSAVAVTISYTEGGTTKTVDLNVLVSERYEKVTALKDVTAGEYVIVNDGYFLPNSTATKAGPVKSADTKVTISNSNSVDIVSGVTSDMTWTFIGTSSSAMTIKSTKSTQQTSYYLYVAGTSNNNQLRVNTTSDHTWTIAVNGSAPAFSLKDNSNDRYCATYSTGSDWRSYNSATASNYGDDGKVYLYKKNDGKVDASVQYKKNNSVVSSETITYGESYTPPTLDKPGISFTSCSSDNETVAKVGSDGAITLTGAGNAGKAVITLTWNEQTVGEKTYRAGSASYTLTINKATPTIDAFTNPITGVTVGNSVTNTTTISNGLSITYTSGNTSVATVDASTGEVTGVSNGVATISATFAGNANYTAAEPQSYNITVSGGSAVQLSNPASISFTALSKTSFTATWAAVDHATSYDWVLSSSNTAAGITAQNTIASGDNLTTATCTVSNLSLVTGPYYLYVKTNGNGTAFLSSDGYDNDHKDDAILISIDFTSTAQRPSGFPTSSGTTSGTHTIDSYSFSFHAQTAYYWGSYLMLGKSDSYMLLPAIQNKKLKIVGFTTTSGVSTNVVPKIKSSDGASTVFDNTSAMAQSKSYSWSLTSPSANTSYRFQVTNGYNIQLAKLDLAYFN